MYKSEYDFELGILYKIKFNKILVFSNLPNSEYVMFVPELKPHEPSHGLRHFSAIHALSEGQSVFTTHSGLQLGGEPK